MATGLTHEQRRLVTGIFLIAGGFVTVTASYNYILDPMLQGLGASESQTALLRQLPSIGALLVVFLGGVLGDRYGVRKMLRIASVLFTIGCSLVAVAPVFPVASLGMVIEGVAASGGGVMALGLLSARIAEPAQRASAFSAFGIVTPLIFMVVPILAGALVGTFSWRFVAGLWVLGGLVMMWSTIRLLPPDEVVRGGGEVVTPALAGVALAAGVQSVTSAANSGLTSIDTLIRVGICALGLVVLVVLFRRPGQRSLSLAALRRGAMLILLAVVLLVPFTNIWFYATVGFQYIFGLSVLQTALIMIPVQLAGIAGAIITRKVLQNRGVRVTGTAGLTLLSLALLSVLLVQATSPLWVPVVTFAFYGLALTAVSIPITNAIMNTAAHGEEGSASAFRSAAGQIGSALGVLFTTSILVTITTMSTTANVTEQGLASQQSREVIDVILAGATPEQAATQYSVPAGQAQTLDTELAAGMIDGLHGVVLAGAIVALLCAGGFAYALRRQERAQEAQAAPA